MLIYIICNFAHGFDRFVCLHTNLFVFEPKQGLEEGRNYASRGEGRARRIYVEQDVGFTPITTYPSNIPKDLPWESGVQQITLEGCRSHYDKLKHDLSSLDLHPYSKQSLERVLRSLQKFIEVCEGVGLTMNGFIDLIQRIRAQVMDPYKWFVVEERVTKE